MFIHVLSTYLLISKLIVGKITGIVLSDWDKYIISSDMDGRIVITKNPVGSSEIVALGKNLNNF